MPELYRPDIVRVDLEKPVKQSYVGEALITGDNDANRYGAEVYRGEEAVDLSGCTGLSGYNFTEVLESIGAGTAKLDGTVLTVGAQTSVILSQE